MKKLISIAAAIGVLLAATFLIYQNRPTKRFHRNLKKAKIYLLEKKWDMAKAHYVKAYNIKGGYTPWVSKEVLQLENALLLKKNKPDSALKNIQSFIAANKNTREGRVMLASLAFLAKRPDLAFKAIEEVLAMDPLYFPARLLLSKLRLSQGRSDLAEEEIRILYNAYPDSALAMFPLLEVLINQGKFKESKKMLASLKKKQPDNKRASLMLIDIYTKEGKVDSIIAELDKWVEKDTTMKAAVDLRKVRLFSMTNKLDQAVQILKNYEEIKEENLNFLTELAIIHVKRGNPDQALEIYGKVKELNPALWFPVTMMSHYLLLHNGKMAKSLELIKSVHIKKKSLEVVKQIIISYLALDQKHKALEFIKTLPDTLHSPLKNFILELEPNRAFLKKLALLKYYQASQQNYWTHKITRELHEKWPRNAYIAGMYARQLASLRRVPQAIKVLERLSNPSPNIRSLMLSYYFRAGLDAKALSMSNKMRKKNPKLKGINSLLGIYYFDKKQSKKACQYFENELALDPNNTIALNNLAWQYGVVGKNFKKARPYLDALIQSHALDPRVLDTQGWIYAMNGRLAEADSIIQLSINLLPDHPTILYHGAFIKARQGKKDQSRKYLEKALGSRLKFEERKDAEKLLQSL